MWLCDVTDWEMMRCELRRAHLISNTLEKSIPMRGATLGCKAQEGYAQAVHHHKVGMQNVMHRVMENASCTAMTPEKCHFGM